VRFVPNANWNGTVAAGLTFFAWDQTEGVAGDLADVSVRGGARAYSLASASAAITVNSVADAPVIVSNGGGPAASISVTENGTFVTTVMATDGDGPTPASVYSIVGGADAARFTINASTGVLRFLAAPDFESPTDSNADNIYLVTVQASDGGLTTTQSLTVTVTNLAENAVTYADGAIWRTSGDTTPNIASWTGSSFLASVNTANAGQWRVIDGADSPTRDEKIVLGTTTAGTITGQIYSNGTWSLIPNAVPGQLATGIDSSFHNFDVAYENLTGDALLAWAGPVAGLISYRTWNGTSWSAIQNLDTRLLLPLGTAISHINLVAGDGNQIVMQASNTSSDDFAYIWNGTNWIGGTQLGTNNTLVTAKDANAAIEWTSGRSMVVYDDFEQGTVLYQRIWDPIGLVWQPFQTVGMPAGVTGDPYYTFTASDRRTGSNRIAVGALTNQDEAWASVWDGTSWVSSVLATTTVADRLQPTMALAFEGKSGQLMFAYAKAGSSNVFYRTWTNAAGWSGEITGPAVGGEPTSLTLSSDPDTNRIMLSVQNANNDLLFSQWDGTAWSSPITVEMNTGEAGNQPYLFLYDGNINNPPFISSNGAGPTAIALVAENTTAVTTVVGSDSEVPAQPLTYSIVGGADAALFDIHPTTGVLRFLTAPDREAPTDANLDSVYEVTVQVSDGLDVDTQAISVTVTDANEFSLLTLSDINPAANSVSESTLNGTLVGITARSFDGDATNSTISYSLSNNAGGRFAIDSTTGIVTVANASLLNFEAASSYTINIRAQSADGSFVESLFTIAITDVNEFSIGPISDIDAQSNFVPENAFLGATVGITANAVDADVSNSTIVYSLVNSSGGLFSIDSLTGVVRVAGALDREAGATRSITVRAESADGSFTTADFTINIGDLNEFPVGPVSDVNLAANAVVENSAVGTVVGITALATDPDSTGNSISYSLTDSAGGQFAIDGSTGVVTVAGSINREAGATRNITVRATSADGSTSDATFTIDVADVDEFDVSAVTDIDPAVNTVLENSPVGTVVGITAFAEDNDATNNTITYTLDDNAGGQFTINASTGVVTVAGAIDREAGATRSITVRATSADGSFSTATFTIDIGDVNESAVSAITDSNPAANTVLENSAVGTAVGITAFAEDIDATNNAITYTLDDSAGGQFTIDSVTGIVTVAGAVDREAGPTRSITVRATSADGSSSVATFTIAIGDVNESAISGITDIDPAANTVPENSTIGTAVGITAFAEDIDATNNSITYTLDDSAGGQFAIDSVTGIVTVAGAIDREAGPTRSITVRATSADGSSSVATFTIAIGDVNESPISAITDIDPAVDMVVENSPVGTVVGITAFAEDIDATNNSITYTLDDNAGGQFTINAVTGVVTVAGAIDFEAGTTRSITVRATSEDGSSSTRVFTIAIGNVNDLPISAISDIDPAPNAVPENSPIGTPVGITAFATDEDGTNNTIQYTLDNNGGGRFTIDPLTGIVTLAGPVDRESASSATIVVRATSSDGSFSTATFTIAIGDVNEFPVSAITDVNPAANHVLENAAVGTLVGITAFATDPDATNNAVTYSLDDSGGGRFSIDPTTGVITVSGPIDRELGPTCEITIRATSQDGSFSTSTIAIAIGDVDEFDISPIADTNSAANYVLENAAVGTAVGITAFASDPDATNNAVSYSLINNDGGRFAIHATTGVVTVAGNIDREAGATRTITVRAQSTDGSSSTESFTINVGDVNEFPVSAITDVNPATNYVLENAPVGTLVGITAFATDPDATNNAVTYSLDDSGGGRFSIDPTTGVITVSGPVDREPGPTCDIVVRATSQDGSFSTLKIVIAIGDVNEFPISAITDVNSAANHVLENAAVGTLVGITAFASDPDATNNAVSYSLTDNDGGRFAIHATTGVVTVAGNIDREEGATRTITVRAQSTDGSSSIASFTINVGDVNEFPVSAIMDVNPATNYVLENAPVGTLVGITAFATDPDATNNAVTYSLDDSGGGRFSIDPTTGVVTVSGPVDRELGPTCDIVVRATSQDGSFQTLRIVIAIGDVNDNPISSITDVNPAANQVAENSPSGTLVGITARAVDPDSTNNTVTYTLVDDSLGAFAIDVDSGVIRLIGAVDREATPTRTVLVRAESMDGSSSTATFVITIVNVNEPPTSIVNNGATVPENGTVVIGSAQLRAQDIDTSASGLVYTVTTNTAFGQLRLNGAALTVGGTFTQADIDAGRLVYAQNGSETPTDGFNFRLSDGGATAITGRFQITVTPINDAPIAANDFYYVQRNQTLALNAPGVMANDVDAEGQPLTLTLLTTTTNGLMTLLPNGAMVYQPGLNFTGYDKFTYRISDGVATSDVATVTIRVSSFGPLPRPEPPLPPTSPPLDPGSPTPSVGPVPRRRVPAIITGVDVSAFQVHKQLDLHDLQAILEFKRMQWAKGGKELWTQFYATRRGLQGVEARLKYEIASFRRGEVLDQSAFFVEKLRPLKVEIADEGPFVEYTAGTVFITAVALTAGFIFWAVKGGFLVASFLSQVPAWKYVDPLPIFDTMAGKVPTDGEAEGEEGE
jgi:hypothetical protein